AAPAVLLGAHVPLRLDADSHAAAPAQMPSVIQRTVGDIKVTALSDGFFALEHEVMQGIEKPDFDAMLTAAYKDPERNLTAVNAYLVEAGDVRALIDVGTGSAFGPTLGQLPANLASVGIEPADVTHILATHLHPDHIGGVVGDSALVLPNAELVAAQADHDFFTSSAIKAQAPEQFQPFFDLAAGAVGLFKDRFRLIDGEQSVAPGITALPMPGHTPGHTGFMISSGRESLLIWGDIVHVPAVQFARPDVAIAFDTDVELARASRAEVLDMAATDKVMIAGMHMPFPGFGYVETAASGYRFVPAPWDYF
ncbi:MAG: MBL fold metallo-hydrolase, partial [Pseudomonadota bacterium]